MKISDLSSKKRSSYHWINFAAASLLVAALAGCGGGGGGDTTAAAPGTPAAPAAPAAGAVPAGTAVITAAAASPATTNTEANPDQAFGLVTGVGASAVTVNSPPVVNFTVIDSTGKFVPGLTLFNSAGTKADPACAGNNVTAAIAKFDGSNWQSLISLQRLDADVTTPVTRYSVVEGTADPKPTATLTNPDTAVADPSTRVVGILEENAAGGYYTYRFAMDVSTPLLLKDAVAGRNVASSAATSAAPAYQRRVANNGNVAVKDGKTVHRVGLQLCYTDPATKAKVNVNPTIDFTLNADGSSVPVTAADGKTLARANAVVDVATCNECHEKLAIHGNIATGNPRVDTDFCVICHNVGSGDYYNNTASSDPNAGGSVSFKSMIHKVHAGKTVLTKDFKVASVAIRATDKDGNVTGFAFPQDVRNCTKCHDNTKAAQADNWMTKPSRLACSSCHDGIDFKTGGGYKLSEFNYTTGTAPATGTGHDGGARADDTACANCHDTTTVPLVHRTVVASPHNATVKTGVASFEYKLTSATINAARQLVVGFQILKDGSAVKLGTSAAPITGFTGGPSFLVIYATGQDGIAAPTDWNSGHAALKLADAIDQVNGNTMTVDAAGTTYTLTINASSVSVRGTTTTPSQSLVLPADAKMVTAVMAGAFTQTGVTERAGLLPGKPAMMAATGNTPDGKANVARRVIFKEDACNTCHDRLGTEPNFHDGNYSIAMCAVCHTPIQGGSTGWSASFRTWVHGIHGGSKRSIPYTWHAVSKTNNYSQIGYPGVIKNCETCHEKGTYDFSASQYTAKDAAGKTIVDYMPNVTVTSGKPLSTSTSNYVFPQEAPVGSGKYVYGASTGLSFGNGSFKVDDVTGFGTGLGISKTTGLIDTTNATAKINLVSSPITAVCTSCHDDVGALSHITTTGYGSFYRPRGVAGVTDANTALGSPKEQCLSCHGPGGYLPINKAHNPNWDFTVTPVQRPW